MTDRHLLERHYGGWLPSLLDPRDLVADPSEIKILAERDPRKEMVKPYDQFQLGSCTGNTVAGAIQYHRMLDKDGSDDYVPSRLDIYRGERLLEHSPVDQDTGAFGRDGFKYAARTGTIDEKLWPYVISKFADAPPEDAPRLKLKALYKAVDRSISAFRAVLSNRQTIAIGFTVFESFESDEVASTGVMPIPNVREEQVLGGHEVLVVGYLKSEPHYALVRNSWGLNWGLDGYFLMPWAVILDSSMSSDFRTIYRPAGK